MDKIAQTVDNFLALVQPYVYIIVVIAIVGCVCALAFGNKNDKVQDAKKYLISGIVAAFLLGGATFLAKMFTSQFAF